MHIYQIIIEYDGTNYVGWQKQKNGKSIQETIEKILKKLLKYKIILYGSGRTDAGVHAIAQSAHFSSPFVIKNLVNFLKSLNFFLKKKNIVIISIKKKNKLFHARFSAKKRVYKYVITNRFADTVLDNNRSWHIRNLLNIKLLKEGGKILEKTRDFSMFRSSSCGAKSPIRNLHFVKIKKEKDKIIIFFQSKSFLQQQVRSMVGCLKYIGEKKWDIKKFKKLINLKKRSNCAPPAPPQGLFLQKVIY